MQTGHFPRDEAALQLAKAFAVNGRVFDALKLVNGIPGAWLAQFPGGGHAFMAQYPRPLADLINSFLELG